MPALDGMSLTSRRHVDDKCVAPQGWFYRETLSVRGTQWNPVEPCQSAQWNPKVKTNPWLGFEASISLND